MASTLNPYLAGPPAAQAPFVGRASALDAALRLVQNPHGTGLVLLGPRVIGKTTLLRHLATALPRDTGARTVYFDLSDKSTQPLGSILLSLSSTIAARLNLPAPDLGIDAERNFRSQWLPEVLAGLPPGATLTLLVDEPDQPARAPDQGTSVFYPYLRSLLERPPHSLRAVLATGRHMDDHADLAIGALRAYPVHRLSPLPSRETAQLIRLSEAQGTLHWSGTAQARVEQLAGGHPLLTRLLCSAVWERVAGRVGGASHDGVPVVKPVDVDAAAASALEAANSTLESLWNGLQPGSQAMASTLAATGSAPLSPAEIDRQLTENGVPSAIPGLADARARLHDCEVLEQSHGESIFRIELFRRWIAAHRRLPQVLETLGFADTAAQQRFLDAQKLHRTGDLEHAAAAARHALTLDPGHVRAAMLLAGILLEKGHPGPARDVLEPLLETHPFLVRPHLVHTLIELAHQTRDDAARLAILDRILELDPSNPDAKRARQTLWLEQGYHARKTGRLENAQDAFRKADREDLAAEVTREIRFRELEQRLEPVLELETQERYQEALEVVRRLAAEFGDLQNWGPELDRIRGLMRLAELYSRGIDAINANQPRQAVGLFRQVLELSSPYKHADEYLELALKAAGELVEPAGALGGKAVAGAGGSGPVAWVDQSAVKQGGRRPQTAGHGHAHLERGLEPHAGEAQAGQEGDRGTEAGKTGPSERDGGPSAAPAAAPEPSSHAPDAGREHAASHASQTTETHAHSARAAEAAHLEPASKKADEHPGEKGAARGPRPAPPRRWWPWATGVVAMMNLVPLLWWLGSHPPEDLAEAGVPAGHAISTDLRHTETGNGSSQATPSDKPRPGQEAPADLKPAPTGLAALPSPEQGGPTASSPRLPTSPEAVSGLRAECDRGKARSCFSLAWMYRNGNMLDRDDARAASLFRKACAAGDAPSCNDLAMQYQAGAGLVSDSAAAVDLYRKACDLRDRNACKNLATMYYNGRGTDRNVSRAISLFQKACDLDSFEGCNSLGALYDHGEGAPRDLKRAVALFQQSCEGGYTLACQNLGIQYEYGKGVTRDPDRAVSLYDQACNAGRRDACGFATQLRAGAFNSTAEIRIP